MLSLCLQMKYSPAWFQSLAWLETVFQLPFFVAGIRPAISMPTLAFEGQCRNVLRPARVRGLLYVKAQGCAGSYAYALGKAWIRTPAIIYGISTATTVVPCLAEIAAAALPLTNRLTLMAIYTPYFLIPAVIAARMLTAEEAFTQRQRHLPKKRN